MTTSLSTVALLLNLSLNARNIKSCEAFTLQQWRPDPSSSINVPAHSSVKLRSAKSAVVDIDADNDFSSLKVLELRKECSARGIVSKGLKKADLITALNTFENGQLPQLDAEAELSQSNSPSNSQSSSSEEGFKPETLSSRNQKSEYSSVSYAAMDPDFSKMKVVELRQECSVRGIGSKGLKKAELISALNALKLEKNEATQADLEVQVEQSSQVADALSSILEEFEFEGLPNNDISQSSTRDEHLIHDFAEMKVAELRRECEIRGIISKGLKKGGLIDALSNHVSQLDITADAESSSLSDTLSSLVEEDLDFELLPNAEDDSMSTSEVIKRRKKKVTERTKAQIKKLKFFMMRDVEDLIRQQNETAIPKAQDNIHRLEKMYRSNGNSDYKPKILNYIVLVRAYGKLGRPEQAEKTLKDLMRKYQKSRDEDIKPTVITWTEVIDAYAKSRRRNAAEKAEELLFEMMEYAENEDGTMDENVAPTSITCDAVLNAWARRGTKDAAERAEQILERMEYLRQNGNVKIQPTAYSFATVISAWAKVKTFKKGDGKENAERAQYILTRMDDFRKRIEKEDGGERYAKELECDAVVYNSVIDAWARSKDPIAGTRAEELLLQMEEDQRQGNGAAPDTITYNSVINCHAASGHINAGKAAERVLKKMEIASRAENGSGITPNTRTYNQVLKAYSKSSTPGRANRAEKILMYMLQSGDKPTEPDVISFSTCLDVWAKSKEPGKAEKAYSILQKMIEYYKTTGIEMMKPNEVSYNTCFNACAFSAFTPEKEKKQALTIAINLFKEMETSDLVKPDAISFGMLIKCVANLVPRGKIRNKMASDLFIKCKNEGLVNGLVFDEIRRAVPGNVMAGLLGDVIRQKRKKPLSQWQLRDLPFSWKKNVVESKPKKKRKKKVIAEEKNPEKSIPTVTGDPIRPMRRIVEQSWQSGRDV